LYFFTESKAPAPKPIALPTVAPIAAASHPLPHAEDQGLLDGDDRNFSRPFVPIFGDDFPGHPDGETSGGVETLGFYLPWHRFDADIWSIYIIADAIISAGNNLCSRAKGFLSIADFFVKTIIHDDNFTHYSKYITTNNTALSSEPQ
jgi:hypothetical protein